MSHMVHYYNCLTTHFDSQLNSCNLHFRFALIVPLCQQKLFKCREVRANKLVCKLQKAVAIATYRDKMPVLKAHDRPFDGINGSNTFRIILIQVKAL